MANQTLREMIDQDLKDAMRNKDEAAKLALRSIKTGIMEAEKASGGGHALDDNEIVEVIQRLAKQRRDAIDAYKKAGRADLLAAEEAELRILERYLPKQLTEEEVEAIVRDVITEIQATSLKEMGQVMRVAMERVAGKADGRVVNQVARRLLGN